MGQVNSNENTLPETVDIVQDVQDEIVRHARNLSELAFLTYEEFLNCIEQLNQLTEKYLDPNGKQLVFFVKKGTDTTMLWKGTVRIACVKRDPVTRKIDTYKLLTLPHFMKVFRNLQCQLVAFEQGFKTNDESQTSRPTLQASTLMAEFDNLSSLDTDAFHTDCCICLERKPEVMLPCAHSYCVPCIEQWNVNHKTCPICRETLSSTDDTWVLYEAPDAAEINQEISSTLDGLTGSSSST